MNLFFFQKLRNMFFLFDNGNLKSNIRKRIHHVEKIKNLTKIRLFEQYINTF